MRIALAQSEPVKGDIFVNIQRHLTLIELARDASAQLIIFPELSITGYEPELAESLATDSRDSRFQVFQDCSNQHELIIAIGCPTKSEKGIHISQLIFHPNAEPQTYSKQFLHEDEDPYFVPGSKNSGIIRNTKVALGICYETSIPSHATCAFDAGADVYIASVVKSVNRVARAQKRLSEIAKTHSANTLLVNSIGISDGKICGGQSSIYNTLGELLEQIDHKSQAILVFDTETKESFAVSI